MDIVLEREGSLIIKLETVIPNDGLADTFEAKVLFLIELKTIQATQLLVNEFPALMAPILLFLYRLALWESLYTLL